MQEKGNYRLWKVADSGGQPTHALADGPPGQQASGQEFRPWFLPEGRTLLYVSATLTKSAVYAGKLDSPDRVKVVDYGGVVSLVPLLRSPEDEGIGALKRPGRSLLKALEQARKEERRRDHALEPAGRGVAPAPVLVARG